MFDIFRSIKKISGLEKKPEIRIVDQPAKENIVEKKIDKLSNFFDKAFNHIISEYSSIRKKAQDLSTANYNLGMRHLENGNVKEAIFRFKITKKFWPQNYEAHYQLIACLILNKDFDEAQKIIDDLLEKSPAYQEKIGKLLKNSKPV